MFRPELSVPFNYCWPELKRIQGSSLIHLVNFLLNDDHHAQSHCTWEPGSGQRPEKDPRDGTTNINRSRPLPGLKRVDITNLAKAQYSSLCDKERWGCPDGGFLARAKAAQPTVVQGELALDLGLQPLALPLQVGTDEVMSVRVSLSFSLALSPLTLHYSHTN